MTDSRQLGRNVLWTFVSQILSWAVTFGVMLYVPRYVGDTGLGQLAYAGAIVALIGAVAPLGTSQVLVKNIAREPEKTGELLAATLVLRFPIVVVASGLAMLAITAIGYPAELRLVVAMCALGAIVGTLCEALESALQGEDRIGRRNVGMMTQKFVGAALMIALCLLKQPLWTIAATGFLSGLVELAVDLHAFRTHWRSIRWPKRETISFLIRTGRPYMGWGIFLALYGYTDPIVLKILTNDATNGWYALAFRLMGTTMFLPTAITTTLSATLNRLYVQNQADFANMSRRTLALVMLCGVPIALVLILLPANLIHLLHYPPQFAHSIPVLRIGGVGVLLWYAANVLGTLVMASDGQEKMFRISMAATAIGIPLCFLFSWIGNVYWHNGAAGAMLSDVVLEVYLIAGYIRMLPKGTLNWESVSLIARYGLASLPMAALLALLSQSSFGLLIVIPSAVLYVAMCAVLKCISLQDLTMARQILARKV